MNYIQNILVQYSNFIFYNLLILKAGFYVW